MGIVEFNGSKKNNIILMGKEIKLPNRKAISHNFSPFIDKNPDCKPSEKYKAVGGGAGGLYALTSADGIHWALMKDTPVVTDGAFDSQNIAFWDTSRKCYVEYHRLGRNGGRDVKTSTSKDFLNWSKASYLEYTPGRLTELYTSQIEQYHRAPHLHIGFPPDTWPGEGGTRRSMRRYRGTAVVAARITPTRALSPAGTGSGSTSGPRRSFARPVARAVDVHVRLHGLGRGRNQVERAGRPERTLVLHSDAGHWFGSACDLCRYTLRLDGFVSAKAPLSGGWLLTKPIVFEGEQLKINFETSIAGSVRIEIQDAQGKPIPGFTLTECPELFGNSVDYPVKWKGEAKLSDLAGKPVRLRFVLKDADLYAFQFGKE